MIRLALTPFKKQVREFGERMNKGGSGMMMMQKMMEGMTNPEAKSKEEHHPDKD